MAISGPQALRKLDEAVSDVRSEEQKISSLLARSTERIAKLKETQSALYSELAQLQLDKLARKELGERFLRAERTAHKILEQHDKELIEARKNLKLLDAEVAKKATNRHELLAQITTSQKKLSALSDKIQQQIEKDPNYKALQKKIIELVKIAKQSMAKTKIAQQDSEKKGQPYKNDPLFMYLWQGNYGTKNYKAGNLTRWLDSMVARLVKYNDARPNFKMLNEIPLRLNEHADYQASLAEQAEDELDALEITAIDSAGGKPMRQLLLKTQQELSAFDIDMAKLEDERDELAQQYNDLAKGNTPTFEKATKILAKNLQDENITALFERTKTTSNPQDDRIVKKIDAKIALIKEEQLDNKTLKKRLRTLSTRRRELEDIEWEFKKARFDDPRSTFRKDSLTGSLLSEFLAGAISAAVYWNQWQGSQSWRSDTFDLGNSIGLPRPSRRSRSSRGRPSPWGNSSRSSSRSGGGFSRPRSSSRSSRSGSRGSRSGGGFKTGGGF